MALLPDNVTFCLLSFEGPDPYSQAGGLRVHVTHLAETLARRGFETSLRASMLSALDPERAGE